MAQFPGGHPVRHGDRVELAVDVSELSLFDPATGQALWNPAAWLGYITIVHLM